MVAHRFRISTQKATVVLTLQLSRRSAGARMKPWPWQAMHIPVVLRTQAAVAGQRDTVVSLAARALSAGHNLMIGGMGIFGTQNCHIIMATDLPEADLGIKRAWYGNGKAIWISTGSTQNDETHSLTHISGRAVYGFWAGRAGAAQPYAATI